MSPSENHQVRRDEKTIAIGGLATTGCVRLSDSDREGTVRRNVGLLRQRRTGSPEAGVRCVLLPLLPPSACSPSLPPSWGRGTSSCRWATCSSRRPALLHPRPCIWGWGSSCAWGWGTSVLLLLLLRTWVHWGTCGAWGWGTSSWRRGWGTCRPSWALGTDGWAAGRPCPCTCRGSACAPS